MNKLISKFPKVLFILLFALSLTKPQLAYAQEGVTQSPDPAATDPITVTEAPVSEPTAAQTEVPVVTETVAPESTQEPAVTPTDIATIIQTTVAAILGDSTATDTSTESTESVADIVDTMADANAALVDESGNVLPLASVEAEDALTNADPWFVDSTDPTHVVAYFATQAGCDGWAQPAGYGSYSCFVDDTPIQAAINSDLSTDSTINLSGTFTETVTITKNVTLDGGGTTVIAPQTVPTTNGVGSTLGTIFVDGTASAGDIYVTIKNLVIDGSNVSNPFGVDGLTLTAILVNNANVTLLDNSIRNFLSSEGVNGAAVVLNGSNASISNNSFTNNGIGIAITGNSNASGANNVFSSNGVRVTITKGSSVDLGLSSVYTDKGDYAPGSFVIFSGDNGDNAGFLAGETVHVDVSGPNGYVAACDNVVSSLGGWSCQVQLWPDDRAVGDYAFTATGLTSGVSFSGVFSDSNPATATALVCTPSTTVTMNTPVTCTATVSRTNSSVKNTPLGTVAFTLSPATVSGTLSNSGACSLVDNGNMTSSCSITYTPTSGTGTHTLTGTYSSNNGFNASSGSVNLTVNRSLVTPTITWPTPADIVYGTALGAAQLNASATVAGVAVAGTYTYTPPSGTVLNAGTGQNLHVVFTPTDATLYTTASADVQINVSKANPNCSTIEGYSGVYDGLAHGASGACKGVDGAALGGLTLGSSYTDVPGGNAHWVFQDSTGNYNNAAGDVTITITVATPYIKFGDAPTPTYLGGNFTVTATTNSTSSIAFSRLSGPCTWVSDGTFASTGAGICVIQANTAETTNFAAQTATLSVTIAKAKTSLSWATPADITYGTALSTTQLNASASAAGSISYDPAAETVLSIGAHTLKATFTPDDPANYEGAEKTVSINVTKSTPVITWSDPANIVYGTALGAAQMNATASVPGSFSYSFNAGDILSAGPHNLSVTFTPDDSVNYETASKTVSITVEKLLITVTADPQSKVYGTADPELTYTFSPALIGSDTFSGALARPAGENVNSYSITQGTLSLNSNYSINYFGSVLTVTAKSITVTADAKSKAYGTIDPALTYTYSPELIAGDSFSGSLARSSGENAGTYPINQGTLSLGSNYSIAFVPANFTISKLTVNVTAVAKTKVYGNTNPALTYTSDPALLPGNAFSGALTRVAGNNVGTYNILQGTLSAGNNYTIVYTGNLFTITPRAITVTADQKIKTYGNSDPALTYKVTSGNLVGSDKLTGALNRAPGENVGSYAINQGTLDGGKNYTLTFVSKNLTIIQRQIWVTADVKTKVFGEKDPALTYSVVLGSLAYSDAFSGALTRDPGENAGFYDINQGTLALNSNYNLIFTGSKLAITPRPLTVTVDAKTKVYGNPDPAFTYALTSGNLIGSDSITGTLSRLPGESVGKYLITRGSLTAGGNYLILVVNNLLTITPKTISVTAEAKTKVYNTADPALTYLYNPALVGSDTFSGGLARVSGETVGTYKINQGTLKLSSNYVLSYTPADFTITQATPDLSWANPADIVYGTGLSTAQLNATSSLAGTFAYSESGAALSTGEILPAGTHTLKVDFTPSDTNYAPASKNVKLVVTPRPITVTADDQSKALFGSEPVLTYKVTSGSLIGTDAFSGAPVRVAGEYPGKFPIQQGTLTLGSNYDLGFINGVFTIYLTEIKISAGTTGLNIPVTGGGLGIPVTGGKSKAFSCEADTIFRLANGDFVTSNNKLCGMSGIFAQEFKLTLPKDVPAGNFSDAFTMTVLKSDVAVDPLPADARLQYSFNIPTTLLGKTFTVFFWDEKADKGQGDWVELPAYAEKDGQPVITSLYPDDPSELRTIFSGVQETDTHYLTFTTNFNGMFLFVTK